MGKIYNFKCYWNTNFENKYTNDEMYKTALDPAGIDFYKKIKSDKDNMESKAKEFKLRRRYIEVPSTN